MREVEYLLTSLAEECAELAQIASKSSRYGITNVNPATNAPNSVEMVNEYHDIMAIMQLLVSRGYLPAFPIDYSKIAIKQHKLQNEMGLHPGGITR